MRIGLVCPYSLDVPGGVQNHVQGLARALLTRGHDVWVLAPGDEGVCRPRHLQTVGRAVPISFNGSVARVAFGPRVWQRTRRWLHEGGFDVVHVHEPTTPSVSLLALCASDTSVVATFHTANPRSRALSLAGIALRPPMDKVSARVAVSEAARSTLVHHLGGEPLVIPNGIFCDQFRDVAPRRTREGPGPTVVFLGRIDEPRKGLAVLVSAFAQVLGRHPGARLLIAGAGGGARTAGVPRALRRHVEFLGPLSDGDRARLLASATAYVAPQLGGESFGVVLVEAMAAGTAVVASDLPAFRAVLDGGRLGELFAVGDPDAAARSICRVVDDVAHRQRLIRAAAADVRRYDWSVVAPQIEMVYETVVLSGAVRTRHRPRRSCEAAEAAVRAHLLRRLSAAVELAANDPTGPTSLALLRAAAHARDAGGEEAWLAQSDLSHALQLVSLRDPAGAAPLARLEDAQRRASVARRIHNDGAAAAAAGALGRRRRARRARSPGESPSAAMIEFDDGTR